MDRGAWWAIVHGVTENLTWLKCLSTTTAATQLVSNCVSLHSSLQILLKKEHSPPHTLLSPQHSSLTILMTPFEMRSCAFNYFSFIGIGKALGNLRRSLGPAKVYIWQHRVVTAETFKFQWWWFLEDMVPLWWHCCGSLKSMLGGKHNQFASLRYGFCITSPRIIPCRKLGKNGITRS